MTFAFAIKANSLVKLNMRIKAMKLTLTKKVGTKILVLIISASKIIIVLFPLLFKILSWNYSHISIMSCWIQWLMILLNIRFLSQKQRLNLNDDIWINLWIYINNRHFIFRMQTIKVASMWFWTWGSWSIKVIISTQSLTFTKYSLIDLVIKFWIV